MAGERFYEVAEGDLRSAPAALRNREPIVEVLRDWLPASGRVLEIASGTGEHAVYFAERLPKLEWQPSDPDASARETIRARVNAAALSNVRAPLDVDASSADWPVGEFDAVLCINMVHISPWAASLGLLAGASRCLRPGGKLILYGPWIETGVETSSSNLAFDADLKARNAEWGLRDADRFTAAARAKGLFAAGHRGMPANNIMLLFELK